LLILRYEEELSNTPILLFGIDTVTVVQWSSNFDFMPDAQLLITVIYWPTN